MTGPEHYCAAERILADTAGISAATGDRLNELRQPMPPEDYANRLARAQVHATLALAAATAATLGTVPAGPWIDATRAEWRKTLSVTLNVTTESDQA